MKFHKKTHAKRVARLRRHKRVRKQISGDGGRPRLCVYRSNCHIYVQVIDDEKGITLVSASSLEKGFPEKKKASNREGAKIVGKLLAERALAQSIKKVRFDRNGYAYHGRILALAESARKTGLEF